MDAEILYLRISEQPNQLQERIRPSIFLSENTGEEDVVSFPDFRFNITDEDKSPQWWEKALMKLETIRAVKELNAVLDHRMDSILRKERGIDMPMLIHSYPDCPPPELLHGIPKNRYHSYVPQVHIDIFNGIDQTVVENRNNGHTDLAIYQGWNEYKNRLKNSKFDDDAMKMMSGILVAVAGQVIAGVMVNRLTSSASYSSSGAGSIVELATVFGLCLTLAGISLRAKSRPLSTLMIKTGAVTTALAIIFSMGMHLSPVMAWTVGPVAFLIMAVAAAFA